MESTTPKTSVRITVEGAAHSGKGTVIAKIVKTLQEAGAEVLFQQTDSNMGKLSKPEDEITTRLANCKILIIEQQTAK